MSVRNPTPQSKQDDVATAVAALQAEIAQLRRDRLITDAKNEALQIAQEEANRSQARERYLRPGEVPRLPDRVRGSLSEDVQPWSEKDVQALEYRMPNIREILQLAYQAEQVNANSIDSDGRWLKVGRDYTANTESKVCGNSPFRKTPGFDGRTGKRFDFGGR
jgi:hypothetical protein